MNRAKRNAPKPKRFCTTSSSDETMSQRKDRLEPRMGDALTKMKMDLNKRAKIANNLTQEYQTSTTNTVHDFKQTTIRQMKTDIIDDSGHVSRRNTSDDLSRYTSKIDTMDNSRQHTTRARSPSHLQTASLYAKQRDDMISSPSLKRQMLHVQTPTSSQVTRQLNSWSKNNQTHSNTFNPNAHPTTESQYSKMNKSQSFHKPCAQSEIPSLTPQKRPLIHSTIYSHTPPQQSLDCQSVQSDNITHTLRKLDVNVQHCHTAGASSTRLNKEGKEEQYLQTLM